MSRVTLTDMPMVELSSPLHTAYSAVLPNQDDQRCQDLSRGPQLKLRRQKGAKPLYYIHDNDKRISTGFDQKHVKEAQQALDDHIRNRYVPKPGPEFYVQQAIDHYRRDIVPKHARPQETEQHLTRLMEFFRGHECDHVTPGLTASYERWRTHIGKPSLGEPPRVRQPVSAASVRRELETLRACLTHAWKCRRLKNQVPVTLPPKGAPRERWLTHGEAARLLAASIGLILAPCCDIATRRERLTIWRRERLVSSRHLAKFILVGLRTGTRSGAILSMAWTPHPDGGHFDLERRLMFRAPSGERQTKKKKPPCPIPDRLVPHLRRWKRQSDGLFVVTAPGTTDAIDRISKSFNSAVARAGLDRTVTPHVLRHTTVTWLMQAGEPAWSVGGFVGMTVEMIQERYGHHAPEYLRATANAARAAE